MGTHTSIDNSSLPVTKQNTSLFDLLVMFFTGVIGMNVSNYGFETNDPIVYGLGLVIMVVALGYGTVRFIRDLRNLVQSFREKDRYDKSK